MSDGGKGSKRRPLQTDEANMDAAWDRIFGTPVNGEVYQEVNKNQKDKIGPLTNDGVIDTGVDMEYLKNEGEDINLALKEFIQEDNDGCCFKKGDEQ